MVRELQLLEHIKHVLCMHNSVVVFARTCCYMYKNDHIYCTEQEIILYIYICLKIHKSGLDCKQF